MYTSNSSLCLHDVDSNPYPDRVNNTVTLSAGSPWTVTAPYPSLVITRCLNSTLGVQVFIPSRFFAGIIPTALLDQYKYWQNQDDSFVGEPVDPKSSYGLTISLTKDSRRDDSGFCSSSEAFATITRKLLPRGSTPSSKSNSSNQKLDGGATSTLLNVMTNVKRSLQQSL